LGAILLNVVFQVLESWQEGVAQVVLGRRAARGKKRQSNLFLQQSDDAFEPKLGQRSEEHTSELQSRFDLVCRLLLEKKKPQQKFFDSDIAGLDCLCHSAAGGE